MQSVNFTGGFDWHKQWLTVFRDDDFSQIGDIELIPTYTRQAIAVAGGRDYVVTVQRGKILYRSEWQASLLFNERAAALNPGDEASWWNLGIAATALRNWKEARRAWTGCGIELEDGFDEVLMPPVTACVRLDPNGSGEVVWGSRIDPARIQIRNVPLPNSNRRYRDILLNYGAC